MAEGCAGSARGFEVVYPFADDDAVSGALVFAVSGDEGELLKGHQPMIVAFAAVAERVLS